jgi:hypothetical protein
MCLILKNKIPAKNIDNRVTEPLFWLGLSLLLVSVSLTGILFVAIPALNELSRAARSAEKLFDILTQDVPPTLEAIRQSGLEITELTDEINTGVRKATQVVKKVDNSIAQAKRQSSLLNDNSIRLVAGLRAAWYKWNVGGG